MNKEIKKKLDDFIYLLREGMPETTVKVEISVTAGLTEVNITDRTSEDLKREGISMRNIKGEFIS